MLRSSHKNRKIFTLHKKIIRIVDSDKARNSCISLFKKLETLTLPLEYIFSLMNFIVNNQEYFQNNSALHSVNTRNGHDLHIPAAKLSCFRKSACYFCINIFNNLPCSLKLLVNKRTQFKAVLKRSLNTHSFYSVDEFIMFKNES
jgi:hypothetical protein